MNSVMNRPAPALNRLRKGTSTARRILRGLLAPVPPARPAVAAPAPVGPLPAPDPAGLFAADELPPLADIEAAAEKFVTASEQARVADRAKRGAKKILDRLPAGRYGMWNVTREANAREVADLEAIRAIFEAQGLGPVPMKACAASLKVVFDPAMADAPSAAAVA